MADEDVTNKKGIYQFIFTKNEKFLNIRTFTPTQKREAYERQGGVCPYCEQEKKDKTVYELNEMEADHITPWHRGGKTKPENCQMLCKHHNRIKSGR
jgi:5-methylcytosine-specific restriction endonuclease McrA